MRFREAWAYSQEVGVTVKFVKKLFWTPSRQDKPTAAAVVALT